MHVLTDLLSSIAVIAASLWIHYTGQTIIDPLLGAGISIFVLFSAVRITRESGVILLEFTPPRVDLDDVIREVEAVHGVDGVHDVHLWTLCPNINVLDAHIYTREKDMASVERIKRQIKKRLLKYDIKHSTLEFECEECLRDERINRIHH